MTHEKLISIVLIHREFTSPYIAKFIIEENQMYVENACRASRTGEITPDNLSPVPKNPGYVTLVRYVSELQASGNSLPDAWHSAGLSTDMISLPWISINHPAV